MKEKIVSPMISELKEYIKNNNYKAVEEFRKKVKEGNTPLVEEIPDNNEQVLLSFLYEDNEDLESIMVYDGIPGFTYDYYL